MVTHYEMVKSWQKSCEKSILTLTKLAHRDMTEDSEEVSVEVHCFIQCQKNSFIGTMMININIMLLDIDQIKCAVPRVLFTKETQHFVKVLRVTSKCITDTCIIHT